MAARTGSGEGSELTTLDAELRRLARRADRRRRDIGQGTEAWKRWSTTIDEGLTLVDRIERTPARDFAGLGVKFRAILWRIHSDEGVVLNDDLSRALARFGRALARIGRN